MWIVVLFFVFIVICCVLVFKVFKKALREVSHPSESAADTTTEASTSELCANITSCDSFSDMSIEELCETGDEFIASSSFEDYKKAIQFYEAAAKQGSLYGILQSMNVRHILYLIGMVSAEVGGPDRIELFLEDALKDAEKASHWAKRILHNKNYKEDVISSAKDICNDVAYCMGFVQYYKENNNKAIMYLKGIDTTRAKILFGRCWLSTAKDDDSLTKAYSNMMLAIEDYDYISSEKTWYDEMIYTDCILILSDIYRGIPQFKPVDTHKAYSILTNALNVVSREYSISLIKKELEHYHQNKAGRYIYIE